MPRKQRQNKKSQHGGNPTPLPPQYFGYQHGGLPTPLPPQYFGYQHGGLPSGAPLYAAAPGHTGNNFHIMQNALPVAGSNTPMSEFMGLDYWNMYGGGITHGTIVQTGSGEHKVYNAKTNRFVKMGGKVGQQILQETQ